MTINWDFIASLEGAAVTTGYVPLDSAGQPLDNSGVTVASGVDLGQWSVHDLHRIGVHKDTRALIVPYCQMTGAGALGYLNENPLVLPETHVAELDNRVRADFEKRVAERFNSAAGQRAGPTWDGLTDRQQTVVMSVAWQYGTPWARTPKFWIAATSGRWADVIAELRDFGDRYLTRRRKEADYLENVNV